MVWAEGHADAAADQGAVGAPAQAGGREGWWRVREAALLAVGVCSEPLLEAVRRVVEAGGGGKGQRRQLEGMKGGGGLDKAALRLLNDALKGVKVGLMTVWLPAASCQFV